MSSNRIRASALITWMALVGIAVAQTAESKQERDGEFSPSGRWYARAGSASHSGCSRSRSLRSMPQIAWTAKLDGNVEGEPLVWDDRAVVAVRRDLRSACIEVLDLVHGTLLSQSSWFATDQPLAPSMWDGLVAVRAAPNRIAVLAVADVHAPPAYDLQLNGEAGAPLLFHNELYIPYARGLKCFDTESGSSRWEVGGHFVGEVALLDQWVFAVAYEGDESKLLRVDRAQGQVVGGQHDASHSGKAPPVSGGLTIALVDSHSFVRHSIAVPLVDGTAVRTMFNDWTTPESHSTGMAILSEAAAWSGGWIGLFETQDQGKQWILQSTSERHRGAALATAQHHSELLELDVAPTVVDRAVYLGGAAFDLASAKFLWQLEGDVLARNVPTRDGILRVMTGARLAGYTESGAAASSPWTASERAKDGAIALSKARAVLVDRSVVSGNLTLKTQEKVLVTSAKGPQHELKLDDVAWVEDSERVCVYAQGSEIAAAALETLVANDVARRWFDAVRDATLAKDAALAQRALSHARRLDPHDVSADKLEKGIETLRAQPQKPLKPRVDAILATWDELLGATDREFCRRACQLPKEAPLSLRFGLALEALRIDANFEDAQRIVRAVVPAGDLSASPRQLESMVRSAEHVQVQVVSDAPSDKPDAPHAALAAARSQWRPDLVAFVGAREIVLAPPERSSAATHVIAIAELAGRALDELFVDPARPRIEHAPLLIELHDPKEKSTASRAPSSDAAAMQFTTAQHDPVGNRTLVFLSDHIDESWTEFRPIAHVLAHHWLFAANPRYALESTRKMRKGQHFAWIAEGLANWVAELHFDLEHGTYADDYPPRCVRALAEAPVEAYLPWAYVFIYGRGEVDKLSQQDTAQRASEQAEGAAASWSSFEIYEAQICAATRYLLTAEGGKHKAALLDYAHAFFIGSPDERLDFESSFGVKAGVFGDTLAAWVRLQSAERK